MSGVVTYNASSDTATFTPSSALALSTSYTATITTGAIDASGVALASNLVWSFTTSSEACAPPTVISVTPVLTVGVCPSTAVTATFSEAMNPATINTTTFTLTGPGTTPVAGVVTYAASTATFTPTSALTVSTLYTATITTGAQNLNGNALANNYTWSFTTASAACAPPTVISVAPPDGATGICQNTLVVATFSEAMNPSTINTTTFTLAASGTPVAGTVTYDVSSYAATFTPTSPLALDTTYTAAITTGAQDLAGVALASNYPWSFTTAATACTTVPTVPMGTACNFGVLGATPVVSSIGDTAVTGDVGIWPGLSITGFPPGTATALEPGNAAAATAQADLTTAYNYAAAVPGGAILPADIGMETLTPGVYKTTSAQPSLGITGNLTLSGSGVYIFQIVSTLTTAATNSQVILAGGATSQDVFWQVGSSATLGTYTTFQGIIMAKASVTVGVGATLDGSALAETGAVSMDDNIVVTPPCQ
ncbi:MAG: Ig-like domain-containing protein [Candidatus Sulfotelmatobacter sp.]